MSLLHIGGSSGTGVITPEGTEFDGVTDYLSRSSDLVGNVDSKTFTLSCWVYVQDMSIAQSFLHTGVNGSLHISRLSSTQFRVLAYNTSLSVVLNVSFDAVGLTFLNLLISCDLTNASNRYLYVNNAIPSGISWGTYNNDFIDFTQTTWAIGAATNGTSKLKGRLSNIFLDYQYRDLGIEANRRLFITADGKPTPTATLKALNPILYLPMKDASTAHINEGTGGNFVQNGTIDTASRGANQDNCKASYFDGVADYLSRTSLTGIADSKLLTIAWTGKHDGTDDLITPYIGGGTGHLFYAAFSPKDANGLCKFYIVGKNSAGTAIFRFDSTYAYPSNSMVALAFSIDLTSTLNRKVYVNGRIASGTWGSYTNALLPLSTMTYINLMYEGASVYSLGTCGEFYMSQTYTDLSTSNPFWDSVANRPKPVRQVIAETGITPLIAMPLDASNAGNNYGTGGDFTANSAPYVGARGGSEFWARSMSGDGTSGYLKSTNLVGLSASKTITFMCCAYMDGSNTDTIISLQSTGLTPNNFRVLSGANTTPNIDIIGSNSIGTIILNESWVNAMPAITNWAIILLSVNLEASTITLCVNGVVKANTSPTLTNDFLNFNSLNAIYIGAEEMTSIVRQWWQGDLSCMYFTTDYIDFSQEVNRLKFVDGLGYPKDLKAQIDAGVIPIPLIYLPFDEPTNLGKNLGTGGNFVVNGTVLPSSDVLG